MAGALIFVLLAWMYFKLEIALEIYNILCPES